MSFETLGSAIMNTEFLLEKQLGKLSQDGPDGNQLIEVIRCFRRLACGALLMDLDVNEFSDNLYCSAKTYLELLFACEKKQVDMYYHWRSFSFPLLDSIIIKADTLAREIIVHSIDECFSEKGEIEEDFWYFKLIGSFLIEPDNYQQQESFLTSFKQSMDGDSSARYEIVKSIFDSDEVSFSLGFNKFVKEWQKEIANERKCGRMDPYDDPTTANICLEGLALLRLAQNKGIPIEKEYTFIPDIAIQMNIKEFPEDFSIFSKMNSI